jgi:thiol-disulfide isomerase/thioredoxin
MTSARSFLLTAILSITFAAIAEDAMDKQIRDETRPVAPDLTGASAWINTEGGKPITMADLKGKVVLLDFWTYGCVNCMHIIPDLKKLEKKYAKELVVIGVHSAKFANEQGTDNIRNAAFKYGVEHPIANDNKFEIWKAYDVSSWPTRVLIDPDGKFIGQVPGEGQYEVFDTYIAHVIKIFDEKKKIDRNKIIGKPETLATQGLRFPGKIIAQDNPRRLFVADTGHNRIIEIALDGSIRRIFGTGEAGLKDGPYKEAQFYQPYGMAVIGDTMYVADTENHVIRRIELKTGKVETIAGTGKQIHAGALKVDAMMPAKTTPLNTPWDVLLAPDNKTLYIAMAGDHRIWYMDTVKNEVAVLAGDAHEAIKDGTFEDSSFAQASGLALKYDTLYIADSEGSALRALDLKKRTASTVIGYPNVKNSLFTFGDKDGKIGEALLQHPLAVVWEESKRLLLIADTYNHKIKWVDPKAKTSTTYLGTGKPGLKDGKASEAQFDEPGGLAIFEGKVFIADTNNHVIRTADLKTGEVSTFKIVFPK